MTNEHVSKLRHGQHLLFWDTDRKVFVLLQLNKEERAFICWKRSTSKDRRNWVVQNLYLSLKDCRTVINDIKKRRNQKTFGLQFTN